MTTGFADALGFVRHLTVFVNSQSTFLISKKNPQTKISKTFVFVVLNLLSLS